MAVASVQNYYKQKIKKEPADYVGITKSSSGTSSGSSDNGPGQYVKAQGTNAAVSETSSQGNGRSGAAVTVTPSESSRSSRLYLTDYSGDAFETSGTTDRYLSRLKELENNKPEAFESKYTEDIQNILDSIKNRESFQTDDVFSSDLYKTMREQAVQNGQKAMRDTMGSAQAATGGYGSTYAQAVGQQAYDNTLSGFNDMTLDLYDRVYNQYLQEGQELYNQLSMYNDQDSIDYNRYRDTVSDYYTDRDYYAGRYDTSWGQDMSAYQQNQQIQQWAEEYAYQKAQDALSQQNWQTQFDYQKEQDALAQQNWQTQFDYQKEQDAKQLALAYAKAGTGTKTASTKNGKSDEVDGYAPLAAGILQMINEKGYTNSQAYDYIMQLGEEGALREEWVDEVLKATGVDESKALKEEKKLNELGKEIYYPYFGINQNIRIK